MDLQSLRADWLPDWAVRVLNYARTPLGVLTLAGLASALCGTFLHPQGYVVCLGIAALSALGMLWPWVCVRGVRGTLKFQARRGREGVPVPLQWTVRNRWPWGLFGLAFESADRDDPIGVLPVVRGWRSATTLTTFTPDRRGEYPSASCGFRVSTGFPFGLYEASRELEAASSLLVWPRTFAVGLMAEALGDSPTEGIALRDRAGHGGDLLGVRPYRRGDSLRRIHWPQTARHAQLIVCEVQATTVPRLRIVLDVDPASHLGTGSDGSLEWAIRTAASLIESWAARGAELILTCGRQDVAARGGVRLDGCVAAMDALARLDASRCFPLEETLARVGGAGAVVVITTDLGLRRLQARGNPRSRTRFIVLRASGFGDGVLAGPMARAGRDEPLPVAPWVLADDARDLVRRLGRDLATWPAPVAASVEDRA